MNSVMEELATVLAYRSQELQKQEMEGRGQASNDIEDISMEDGGRANGDDASSPQRKKARRVYKAKKKKDTGKPPMGPVIDGRGAGGNGMLALCLSSRRNMCVHERVMAESDREAVDSACRDMTATWVIEANQKNPGSVETCSYYDNFQAAGESTNMPSGVYDLEELRIWGKQRGWCPYYLTRQAINHANILVYNYQYMLDPKVGTFISTLALCIFCVISVWNSLFSGLEMQRKWFPKSWNRKP